jgi:hypothetical protein
MAEWAARDLPMLEAELAKGEHSKYLRAMVEAIRESGDKSEQQVIRDVCHSRNKTIKFDFQQQMKAARQMLEEMLAERSKGLENDSKLAQAYREKLSKKMLELVQQSKGNKIATQVARRFLFASSR